jgi:phosphoglycerate dehydrogenase-like enzyme
MADGWQTGLGSNVRGKALGVVGLGNTGRGVARIGVAFGMKVIAWSQNLTDHPFRKPDNVLATAHIGYVTEDLYRTFDADAAANIATWLKANPAVSQRAEAAAAPNNMAALCASP